MTLRVKAICQGVRKKRESCPAMSPWDCLSNAGVIAGKILEMDNPTTVGKKLGFYAVTVARVAGPCC